MSQLLPPVGEANPGAASGGYVPMGNPPSSVSLRDGRGATGDRLPRPPRRRQMGLAGVAVLLMVGGAATAGLVAVRMDDRVQVIMAQVDIPTGKQIAATDLTTVPVASENLQLIPASQANQLIGRYATQPIAKGRLIDMAMTGGNGALSEGRAAVGVALKAGRMPATGLRPGDKVLVVRAVDGQPELLSSDAVVSNERKDTTGGFGSTTSQDQVVTIVVNVGDAPKVAAASAADQLTIVLVARGGAG